MYILRLYAVQAPGHLYYYYYLEARRARLEATCRDGLGYRLLCRSVSVGGGGPQRVQGCVGKRLSGLSRSSTLRHCARAMFSRLPKLCMLH
jgi:hypothetical protein